jgi:hypothetical protein
MKIFLIMALFTCMAPAVLGQQLSWDICIDGQKKLSAAEGGKPDTLQIPVSGARAWKYLEIRVKEKPSNVAWSYTLSMADSAGNRLFEMPSVRKLESYRIPITEIVAFYPKHRFVRIWLDQHPANPEISIRSKRTLLAVIQLKP